MSTVQDITSGGSAGMGPLFDRRAIALVTVIFLTEAAIGIIFFSLVQQYPLHLLSFQAPSEIPGPDLLAAGAVYAGYALSAYGVAKLPAQPLSGWLADHFGARRLLLVGLAVCMAVIVVMSRVSGVTAFVVTCAAYGLAASVIWPTVYTLVGDHYRASGRGRITAAISGAQVAGSAGGFVGGAIVIDHLGFRAAFGLALALNALALALGLWRARTSAPSASTVETPRRSAPAYDVRSRLHAFRSVLSADLLMLSAILILVSLSVSLLAPDLKPYSANILHLKFSTFAVLLAVPAAAAVLTLIPSGMIADRLGRSTPMVVSAAVWPLSILALTFTSSVPLALLFAALAAFAYALGLPAWSASLIDLSTAGRRGLQVGFASAVQGGGLALGPAIGGETVARFGALAPFRVSAVLMLLVLVMTLAYRTRAGRHYSGSRRASGSSA